MPKYHIDVWQDESIWSWAGKAENEDEAFEAARLQLNDDWECDYETWDDLAADMNGTALLYVDDSRIEKAFRAGWKAHDLAESWAAMDRGVPRTVEGAWAEFDDNEEA